MKIRARAVGGAKRAARWAGKHLRKSVTSWKAMLATAALVIVVLAALDLLLAVFRTLADAGFGLMALAENGLQVHLVSHTYWPALVVAVLVTTGAVVGATLAIRALRQYEF
jgi:hypothetical protein